MTHERRSHFHFGCFVAATALAAVVACAFGVPARAVVLHRDGLDSVRVRIRGGEYARAESLLAPILAERERRFGAADARALDAKELLLAAWVARQQAGGDAAARVASSLVSGRRALARRDPAGLRNALRLAGNVYAARARPDSALAAYEEALALDDRVRPPEPAQRGMILNSIGWLQQGARRYDDAIAAFLRANEAFAREPAPDTALIASTEATIARSLLFVARNEESVAHARRAVILLHASGEDSTHWLLDPLAWLSYGLARRGQVAGADSAARWLGRVAELTLDRDHPFQADVLTIMHDAAVRAGRYADAARITRRLIEIWTRREGAASAPVGEKHIQLGEDLASLGDTWSARQEHARGVEIQERAPRRDSVNLCVAYRFQGILLAEVGEFAAATGPLEHSRDLERALGARITPDGEAESWLAFAHGQLGARDSAIAALRGLAERQRGWSRAAAIRSRSRVAELMNRDLQRLGPRAGSPQVAAVIALYDSVSAEMSQLRGPRHPSGLAKRRDRLLARVWQRADRDTAFAIARDLERDDREAVRAAVRELPERTALAQVESRAEGLSFLLTLAADSIGVSGARRREVWDELVRSRLLVFEVLRERQWALRGAAAGLGDLGERLARARTEYSRTWAERDSAREAALRNGRLDSLRLAKEALEDSLAERLAPWRGARAWQSIGLEDVLRRLPHGTALVGVVRTPARTIARRPDGEPLPCDLAFVARSGEERIDVRMLGRAGALDEDVDRWLALVSRPPRAGADGAADERAVRQAGLVVHRRLWAPLAPLLAGATDVYVVPDGALARVNLAALPAPQGGYLVEHGPLVHLLHGERDLVPADTMAMGTGLLALGAPDFEARPAEPAELIAGAMRSQLSDSARVRFEALPRSGAEVEELIAMWSTFAHARGPATERVGVAASEEAFKRLAPGRAVLHLATHAFEFGAAPAPPLAAATRGVKGVVAASAPRVPERGLAGAPPVLSAGLALSGANETSADPEREDGLLTGEEISSLDLHGVDGVVLSACRSGLTAERGAAVESVQGLQRAFRIAGARHIVYSLWPVEDEAAGAWMHDFYEARWGQGLDAARAVRATQLERLRIQRAATGNGHPFRWAAFQMAGEGN